jgi:preprotein translocase SecF subunit
MRELISKPSFDFMGKSRLCAFLSIVAMALAVYTFVEKGEEKYGTDFTGGHEFLVSFSGDFSTDKIREGLAAQQLAEVRVQAFQGASNEYSLRLSEGGETDAVRSRLSSALEAAFGSAASIVKSDYVGPTVGRELRRAALIAVGLGLLGILLYVAVRFEFAVGLGTIVALFHDVIIATGVYLMAGHVFSMATLAAALTIVGYSVNDTVVVFDRVREERAKKKGTPLSVIVNEAINFTLSRTVITHVLTFFSALALYVLGGGEIKDLSLYLVVGIVCGAYSTTFVVAPIVVAWERWRGRDIVASIEGRSAPAKKAV